MSASQAGTVAWILLALSHALVMMPFAVFGQWTPDVGGERGLDWHAGEWLFASMPFGAAWTLLGIGLLDRRPIALLLAGFTLTGLAAATFHAEPGMSITLAAGLVYGAGTGCLLRWSATEAMLMLASPHGVWRLYASLVPGAVAFALSSTVARPWPGEDTADTGFLLAVVIAIVAILTCSGFSNLRLRYVEGPDAFNRKSRRTLQGTMVGVWAFRRPVATLMVSCASLLAISVLVVVVDPALDGPESTTPLLRLTSLAGGAMLGGPLAWYLAPAMMRRELVPLAYLIAGSACFGLYLSERPVPWLVLSGVAGVALGATVVGAARRLMVVKGAMPKAALIRVGLCAATAGAAAGILGTFAIIALRYASVMEVLAVDCVLLALAGTIASLVPPSTRA